MFLGKGGEDEVCVGDREKLALSLAAVRCTFAEDTPGSHGNQRLQHLISAPLRVCLRLQEAGEAVTLIGLQNMPGYLRQQRADEQDHGCMFPFHTAEE